MSLEQGKHKHKSAIQQVHDELIRNNSYRKKETMQAVLSEQQRRTSIMMSQLECPHQNDGMEETNQKLFRLHEQMREMFHKKEVRYVF